MADASGTEARQLEELRDELATWREGAPYALETFVGRLRSLLSTEKTLAYGVVQRGNAMGVDFFLGDRLPARKFLPTFDAWMSRQRARWGHYNAACPEPKQRNAVVHLPADDRNPSAVQTELYPRFDLHARDNLRVLVCEGPSLLAWVGAYQPEPFRPAQRRLLCAVVAPLRRRLVLERAWNRSPMLEAALVAALDAIPSAAFVVDAAARVLHANVAGRAMLDARRRETGEELSHAVRGRPGRFSITNIQAHGVPSCLLAVLRPERGDEAAMRVAAAAARWELTPKQAQVLRAVVDGYSNRAVAALLGIAEGTAELHVSAVLQKAGVETRSALVACVWKG